MLLLAQGTVAARIDYRFRVNAVNALSFTDADGKSQLASKPFLDDAQLVFRLADPLQISVGQWKVPFSLSQAMSDTTLLLPDRPIVLDGFKSGDLKLEGFSWSRDAGLALLGDIAGGRFGYGVGVFGGDGQNVWPGDGGLLYAGRVQAAPLGEMKLDEVDLARGPARFALGASGSLNVHPAYDDDGNSTDSETVLRVGGDVRASVAGWSIQGEALYGQTDAGDGAAPTRSLGAYGQLGWCSAGGVAPGLRGARLDPSLDEADDGVTQVEGVLNLYLPNPAKPGDHLGHKAQVQLAWTTSLLDGADPPIAHQAQVALAVGI